MDIVDATTFERASGYLSNGLTQFIQKIDNAKKELLDKQVIDINEDDGAVGMLVGKDDPSYD